MTIFNRVLGIVGLLALFSSNAVAIQGETQLLSQRFDRPATNIAGNDISYTDGGQMISADGRFTVFTSNATNLLAGVLTPAGNIYVYDSVTDQVELITQGLGGENSNGRSRFPSISADGRYVVFVSEASNLIAGDTNASADVFLHDREMGSTERVSLNVDGEQLSSLSYNPAISANGNFVVYSSLANNIVTGDTNNRSDIFVYDRAARKNERVSIASDGTQANFSVFYSSISGDGRYVAFSTIANTLVSDDTDLISDVFLHDRLNHTTTRVSRGFDGSQADNTSESPRLSADGRFLVFASNASNLISNDSNNTVDIFVYIIETAMLSRVSVGEGGIQSDSSSANPNISADGRFVTFHSSSSNLVPSTPTGYSNVFIYDRQAETLECICRGYDDAPIDGSGSKTALSANGDFIALQSEAGNLATGDENDTGDIFIYDRKNKTRVVASRTAVETEVYAGNDISQHSSISQSGRYVAFSSRASNLVMDDTNKLEDVFLIDTALNVLERVSVGLGNVDANGASTRPSISADGRYITFESSATNLVADDLNSTGDIFLFDRVTRTTERVTIAFDNSEADAGSYQASINADGQFITFISTAKNLVQHDSSNRADVFIYDRSDRTIQRIDAGEDPNGGPTEPKISADGNFVVFSSSSTNLVAGDTNGRSDIFSYDRVNQEITLVSRGVDAEPANNHSNAASVSGDGRYITYFSLASNLTNDVDNGLSDVFVFDSLNKTTKLVSKPVGAGVANMRSFRSSISSDGRFIVFMSSANNLIADDNNGKNDIFIYDQAENNLTRVSTGLNGLEGNNHSFAPKISADGVFVAFSSSATNFVPDGNRFTDIYLHQFGPDANTAPMVEDQNLSLLEDSNISVSLIASDPENDTLIFTINALPEHGTLTGTAPQLLYRPSTNYCGNDSFTFVANDGELDSSEATIRFTISCVNDEASVSGDTVGEVTKDKSVVDGRIRSIGQLQVTDPDEGEASFLANTLVGSLGVGELNIETNGSWTYAATNNQDAVQELEAGEFLVETFTALTVDETAALISITINGATEDSCDGHAATIIGTDGDDILEGTKGADVIVGLGGKDTIKGLGGDDIICGGAGDDIIFGDKGNDTIFGGKGDDQLDGGKGDDNLNGDRGNDTLEGGQGVDTLVGGAGIDQLRGGQGADVLDGQEGDDILDGGKGDDSLFGGEGKDRLVGDKGDDNLHGGDGDADECDGGKGNDTATACEFLTGVP